ncbi:hypothetical protein GCM10027176_86250 [Actinoallomurus bryophytorum]|uniref:Uncharacterized protein n=1 Tax=Actinoallomurus bryophytorum TaxID=1490222 RepID=A0A543CSQ7_9ACTN|nr:hypothetical protein [Actinoallomurus bryophytorum]TQM00125.1 hypothetical protein FB559_5831 [Actinoallomurus bryophytorum]
MVDDLDEDAVGNTGDPAREVLMAQQGHGDRGDPRVEGFGLDLAPGHGASENGEPHAGPAVDGLLVQLREQFRLVADAREQAAEDLPGR